MPKEPNGIRNHSSARDLSARRRTEQALRESEERYRIFAESVSDGIFTMDEDSTILFANDAAERIFGYRAEELIGRKLTMLMPERLRERHERGLERYLAAGKRSLSWTGTELPGLTKDGREVPLEISFGEYVRDGEHIFTGIVRDITERKEREQALEETAAELEEALEEAHTARAELAEAEEWASYLARASSILAASLDYETTLRRVAPLAVPRLADWCGVDVVGKDGRIQRLAVAHLDPTKEELTREVIRRYPPDPDAAEGSAKVLRTGEPELVPEISDELLEAVARDEEHLRMLRELGLRSAMTVPLLARGRTLGAITFVAGESGRRYGPADLTNAQDLARRAAMAVDNARLYETAVLANQAKVDFLAVMSHELRTPLNAITGYVDLLDAEISGRLNPKQKHELSRIRASAGSLLRIIDEILSYTRMERDGYTLEIKRVDLAELVRAVVPPFEERAREHGLEFRVRLPGPPPEVETDPEKVRSILTSLLDNAFKFTDTGVVELDARVEEDGIVFKVRDTGRGIAPEHAHKVFDPFWQADQALTRRAGGTGLGLSIARRYARLLGGDLMAESTPGVGSTFTVRVPFVHHEPQTL